MPRAPNISSATDQRRPRRSQSSECIVYNMQMKLLPFRTRQLDTIIAMFTRKPAWVSGFVFARMRLNKSGARTLTRSGFIRVFLNFGYIQNRDIFRNYHHLIYDCFVSRYSWNRIEKECLQPMVTSAHRPRYLSNGSSRY